MKEQAGRIIDIAYENRPVPGCTVSKQLYYKNAAGISIFSLAKGTGISAESYEYFKLWTVYEGELEVFTADGRTTGLYKGESILTPLHVSVGVRAEQDAIYEEVEFRKETVMMNELLHAGEVFRLADLLPYQEGKIINMDLAHNDKMKFVIMSLDEGTGLSEHAAPGEALVMALDGEAVIGYEGEEHTIRAGETFKFDKFGKHSVKAMKKFKMALLLVFD
ncbi:MAG: cupin [Lachnospiraceae bacterium]|nr:cupin [Lachnospiraceae bacterium]